MRDTLATATGLGNAAALTRGMDWRYTALPIVTHCFEDLPVYSLTLLIASSVAALVLGLAGGWLLGSRSTSENRRSRELERKLDLVMQEKKAYEDDVNEHFSDTAKLLNSMTDSYRAVHTHLASGAARLCAGQGPIAMNQLAGTSDPSEIPPQLADVKQPLDYAPKTSPDEQGMLSEAFGLDRAGRPEITPDQPALPERASRS